MSNSPDAARRARVSVLLAFGFLTVFFTGVFPPFSNPNEFSHFQTVVAMKEWKTFSIDQAIAVLGDQQDKAEFAGRLYSNKAPGLAFAAYPVYSLLRLVLPEPRSGTSDAIFYFVRLLTVSLVSAIALRRFALRLKALRKGAAVAPLVTLAIALGTPFLFYARTFFSHAWTASLLFLSWDLLRLAENPGAHRRWSRVAGAGLLAGWALISEYNVAPMTLLLALRAAAGAERLKKVSAFAAAAAVPVALLLFYNAICFGSPWTLSSAREASPEFARLIRTGVFGFGPPSLRIAIAYLFHPARGVFVFSPFLLWCVPGFWEWWRSGEERSDFLLAAGATALYFLVMTGYPNWHGGWCLGSRYLLPALLFPAMAVGRALATPLSRGLFAAAAVFSIANHFLLTASFPYFPYDLPWPAATGSEWFLARGWVAPSLLPESFGGGLAALALAGMAFLLPLIFSLRAASPMLPREAVAVLLGLAPLAILLLRPPGIPFEGRLWRAAIFGAYSGRDPQREELRGVALSAATPSERRQAMGAWRLYGPRPGPSPAAPSPPR